MDKTLDIINNSGAFVKGQSQFVKEVLREKVVDLGLPSGLKWATCDIDVTQKGSFSKTPFIYNKSFFSWGNIDGHNPKNDSFEDVYNWGGVNAAEPWYNGQPYGDTKGSALITNIPVDEEFDAARYILGAPWRTPASSEYDELIANCIYIEADGREVDTTKTNKIVTVNGVRGIYLQSKINGARIFFAASGHGIGSIWDHRGTDGNYWSSTFATSRNARSLFFEENRVDPISTSSRYVGFAIRAVHE